MLNCGMGLMTTSEMPKEALTLQSRPRLSQDRLYILCELTWTVAATLNMFLANDTLSTQLLPINNCLSGGFQTTQSALRGEQWTARKIHDFIEKHL